MVQKEEVFEKKVKNEWWERLSSSIAIRETQIMNMK
jgi:hypothetical protein